MGKGVLERFRSIRTALVLFLALVFLSMAATIPTPWLIRVPVWLRTTVKFLGADANFRSPLFIGLLTALTLNVLLCTVHRVLPRLRGGRPRPRLAWLDAGVHLSLILVLIGGGGKALLGTVGTGYLFPDRPETTFTDPLSGTVFPLGFSVVLRERREEFYPLRVRLGVRERATGKKLHQFEIAEGAAGRAITPGSPVAVRVLSTDGKTVQVAVGSAAGTEERVHLALSPGAGASAPFDTYELVVIAYRRDLRAVRGRVAILEGERVAREAWLEVNGGVSHRGTKFFLTSWGADQFGNQFLGIQYSRDPLAPVFWAGAGLLAALLPFFLALRRRPGAP